MIYKNMMRAFQLIAYDNGAVNRFEQQAHVLGKMVVAVHRDHSMEELEAAEKELAALSEENFEEFCIGEQTGEESIAHSVLETAFNGM